MVSSKEKLINSIPILIYIIFASRICRDFPRSTDVCLRPPPHQPCSTWFQARVKDLKGKRESVKHSVNAESTPIISQWYNLDGWNSMKFIFPTWISSGALSRMNLAADSMFQGPLAHVSNMEHLPLKNEHLPNVLDSCAPKTPTNGGLKTTFPLGSFGTATPLVLRSEFRIFLLKS